MLRNMFVQRNISSPIPIYSVKHTGLLEFQFVLVPPFPAHRAVIQDE